MTKAIHAYMHYALVVSCCLYLAACATPAPSTGINAEQVTAVKKLGFQETSDGWQLGLASKLLFETASDELDAADRATIVEVAKSLRRVGIEKLRIEGHTDNVGGADFNLALSMRRATSVAREFVRNGWSEAALVTRGFGLTKPIGDNRTADGRAQNRRVVIVVSAQ